MKLKKQIFILAIVLTAGLTTVSAQKDVSVMLDGSFKTKVFLDGEQIDMVTGTLPMYVIEHFDREAFSYNKEGFHWVSSTGKGSATGLWTGETFKYKELGGTVAENGTYTWKYFLIGDKGSRYLGTATWNSFTDEVLTASAYCL